MRKKIQKREVNHKRIFFQVADFGVSLGNFIFWSDSDLAMIPLKPDNKQHEFGHSIQSLFFGPLYLVLVGLPSILRVVYGTIHFRLYGKRWEHYYDGYPENWADSLGAKFF
jgi:hypothetical protein